MTDQPTAVPVCFRHPGRETWVRCTRCERPICPDCMTPAAVGFQCPECVKAGRVPTTVSPFGGSAAGAHGYVTKTLLGLNILAMLISIISAGGSGMFGGSMGGLMGGSTPFTLWGSQWAYGVADGQYYRMFTSMFLHYGLLHLALNMWALWILGRNLEAGLGPVRYLALYLLSGLGGSVAVYLFTDPRVATAGASGAIFGLFAGLFIVLRKLGRDTSSVLPVIAANLVFTFLVPGISIAGHLGGLITGALVAVAIAYAPRTGRNAVQLGGCIGVFVLLLVLTLARTALLTS